MKSPKSLSIEETQQLWEEAEWILDSELTDRALRISGSSGAPLTIYQAPDGRVLRKDAPLGMLYESRADFIRFLDALESFLRQSSTEDKVPVEQRRGNYCDETEDSIILVKAPVEVVAQAINQIWQINYWEQDVYGREINIRKQGFLIFQFRSHSWTCIREYGWGIDFSKEELQALGKLLNTRLIYYCVSDTGGLIAYNCYDSGQLVERLWLEASRPLEFESQLHSLQEVSNNLDDFLDKFWEEQNIYIPRLLVQKSEPAQGISISLVNSPMDCDWDETFARDDFERVDYMVSGN